MEKLKADRDFIIFVQHSIPGQLVKIKITKKKPTYAEATVEKVLKKSRLEINANYQEISGAPYINLSINEQKNENPSD